MSDSGSSDNQGASTAAAAAIAEIAALLEQVKANKADFENATAAASTAISDEMQRAQAQAASQYSDLQKAVAKSKSDMEVDRSAISELVEKAKASQRDADAIKTEVATIKGATDSAQQSVVADQAAVSQCRAEVEALKAAAGQQSRERRRNHILLCTVFVAARCPSIWDV